MTETGRYSHNKKDNTDRGLVVYSVLSPSPDYNMLKLSVM